MIVYVVDQNNIPLLPTHPARARRLLNSGKAKVIQVVPFTIKLNYSVEKPVGSFEIGVDDGSKYVGVAIKNTKTNEVIFHGQIDHRQDVKMKMESRKYYRMSRRFRIRNRKQRAKNRKISKLAPSIHQRKEVIIRFIKDMSKRLNIEKIIVEEVKFNHYKYKYGNNFSIVEIGKSFLKKSIENQGLIYESTFGYITKPKRLDLNLSKTHSNDACAIVGSNQIVDRKWLIKPRRTKIWENNPTKTCNEKNGFRHYDLIKSYHRNKGIVIGSIRSLKENAITLRTKFDDNFQVSYKKSKLIQRFNGLIYSY